MIKKSNNKKTTTMLNSPIRYLGGKRLLRVEIISRFPKDHICYVEGFCGGAGVFFGKKPSKVEVISDVNDDLMNFYRVVGDKKKHNQLIEALRWELCSRSQFNSYKKDLRDPGKRKELTDVQLAKRYYYVNKMSFAGKGGNFGYATTGGPGLNLLKIKNNIKRTHERLKRVYIENEDYKKIIERYDRKHTVFFFDPPYRTPSSRAYMKYFTDDDFICLKNVLKGIKGKFILTLNKDDFMINLFKPHFRIETVSVRYSVQCYKSGEAEELIIMNYDPPKKPATH